VAEGKERFIDRLGPTLTSGLVIAFLSATSLGAVALRDLVVTSNVDIAYIKGDLDHIRNEFEKFKSPGPRFTKDDGDRHQAKLDELERRLREQETRPPRLNPTLEKLEDKVDDIAQKQAELCQRLKDCNLGHTHDSSGTNNSSSNRSRY
jgi:predicted nuclease with TOPRIM domain